MVPADDIECETKWNFLNRIHFNNREAQRRLGLLFLLRIRP